MPLALVLWIGLLILGVLLYLKTPPAGYVPAKGVGPGQLGSIILAVLYGGIWFVMVGRIADKKGAAWANVVAGIALGLACLMLTLSYFGLTKDQRGLKGGTAANAPAAGGGGPVGGKAAADPMAQSMTRMAERQQQLMSDAQRRDAERLERQREQMERMRRGAGAAPAPPPPGDRKGGESGTGAAAPASRGVDNSTPPMRSQRPASDADAAVIDAVAAEFAKDLNDAKESVAQSLGQVLDVLVQPPKQDIREIKARIAAIDEVRPSVVEMAKRLNASGDDLAAAIKAKDVGEVKASVEGSIRAVKAGWRSQGFAAERLAGVLDRGREEAELLRDNIGKWKYDKNGKVTAKDFALESKISSARFFLEAELKGRAKMLDDLRGN